MQTQKYVIEYAWVTNDGQKGDKSARLVKEHKRFEVIAEDWGKAQAHADELLSGVEERFLSSSPQLKRGKNWRLVHDMNPLRSWSYVLASKLGGKPVHYCKRSYGDSKDRFSARIVVYRPTPNTSVMKSPAPQLDVVPY